MIPTERTVRLKKIDPRWGLALLALAVTACDKKAEQAPTATTGPVAVNAPAGGWSETTSQTAEGGFVMGNPDAPVKLVEYSSMTCPHCAVFAAEGVPALKANYINSGKVSLEMRNFIRDPVDVTASLLARCGGPGPYFKMTEQLYATQNDWIGKFTSTSAQAQADIGKLPENEQYAALAKLGGLDTFAQERGIPADKAKQCLMDLKARDQLVAMNKKAVDEYNLTGTPTFLINGQAVENAYDWASLEPKLKAAVGG
jgi:protein-disulfide isomerase